MKFIPHTRSVIEQNIFSQVRAKHQKLFQFGIAAFTIRKFDSLASNARQVVANTNTASSKVLRLTTNKQVVPTCKRILAASKLVTQTSLVNVDFSTFSGFQTLAFAVQTGVGRAIPVWADCITYPIETAGSQNMFIIQQMKELINTLGYSPRFVFDRGFVIPSLIKFMLKHKITFYIRIKQGQGFYWKDRNGRRRKYKAGKIGIYTKDAIIKGYGAKLRLIISPPPKKKRGEHPSSKSDGISSPMILIHPEMIRSTSIGVGLR